MQLRVVSTRFGCDRVETLLRQNKDTEICRPHGLVITHPVRPKVLKSLVHTVANRVEIGTHSVRLFDCKLLKSLVHTVHSVFVSTPPYTPTCCAPLKGAHTITIKQPAADRPPRIFFRKLTMSNIDQQAPIGCQP
jgi:hypothetical protein